MSEYGLGKLLGIGVGLFVGILVVWLILIVSKKDGSIKCKYDERQQIARGKGYRLGFFVFLIGNALYLMMETVEFQLPFDTSIGLFIIIIAAILADVAYCIFNDAYFSLNENKNRLLIIFFVISIVNIIIGINNICSGIAFTNGVLNYRAMNLFCGFLFIGIFIILFIKKIVSKNEN